MPGLIPAWRALSRVLLLLGVVLHVFPASGAPASPDKWDSDAIYSSGGSSTSLPRLLDDAPCARYTAEDVSPILLSPGALRGAAGGVAGYVTLRSAALHRSRASPLRVDVAITHPPRTATTTGAAAGPASAVAASATQRLDLLSSMSGSSNSRGGGAAAVNGTGAMQHSKPASPYAGTPFAGSPFAGTPFAGVPYAGSPYAGAPQGGNPFAMSPYQGSPYQDSPYNDSPYNGSPHGSHTSTPRTSWYGQAGGSFGGGGDFAAEAGRFQPSALLDPGPNTGNNRAQAGAFAGAGTSAGAAAAATVARVAGGLASSCSSPRLAGGPKPPSSGGAAARKRVVGANVISSRIPAPHMNEFKASRRAKLCAQTHICIWGSSG
eukprot:XP_001692715.1 predicted protein [Chlamydomonas reinhardtii]